MKKLDWTLLLLLLPIIYCTEFLHLDSHPIYQWDESRNANNAIEMAENGHILVRYYDGKPDDWEAKPPLLTWTQALSFKIFGYNELAFRLPVALFAVATALLIFFFFLRVFQNSYMGFFAVVVLFTSKGYVGHHVARTGDHDAVLLFFMLAFLMAGFYYLYINPHRRILWLGFFCLGLGVLTKSIAAFFYFPGLIIFLLSQKRLVSVFRKRDIYIGIGIFLLFPLVYYTVREWIEPGYLEIVWTWELLPKFTNSSGNHLDNQNDFLYYIRGFFDGRFTPWIWLLPLAIFSQLKWGSEILRKWTLLLVITSLSLLLILSMGTGDYWYDAPVLILFALIVGTFVGWAITHLLIVLQLTSGMRHILTALIFLGVFSGPLSAIIKGNMRQDEVFVDEQYKYPIEWLQKHRPDLKTAQVFHKGYNAALLFYLKREEFAGRNFSLFGLGNVQQIQPGICITCQPEVLFPLTPYHPDTVQVIKDCLIVDFQRKKE